MRRVLLGAIFLAACRETPKATVDAGPRAAHVERAEIDKNASPTDVSITGDFGTVDVMAVSGSIVFDVAGKEGLAVVAEEAKVTPHPGGRVTLAVDARPLLLEAPANAAAVPRQGTLPKDLTITVTEPGAPPRKGVVHLDAGRYLDKGFRLVLDDVARGKPLASASPAQAARSLVYVDAGGETVQHFGKVVPLHAVDLVAHAKLGPPRKGPKCAYARAGNPAVKDEWPRVEHDLEITVRLANDGSTLTSKTFSAADAPCPTEIVRGQLVVNVAPDAQPIRDWLATLVSRD